MSQESGDPDVPEAVEEARNLFSSSGLVLPPIPTHLAKRFKKRRDWLFSSRPVRRRPYFFMDYAKEAATKLPRDFVLVSHDGHGINSYGMHYYLVARPLLIYVQIAWGGGLMDTGKATEEVNRCFGLCHDIVNAAEDAKSRGVLGIEGFVPVIATEFFPHFVYPPFSLAGHQLLPRDIDVKNCTVEIALSETLQWIESKERPGTRGQKVTQP